MRRAVVFALMLALSGAGAASAAQASKGSFVVPPAPTPSEAGLRGAEDAAPVPLGSAAAIPAPPAIGQSRLAQSGLRPFTSGLASPGLAALGLAPAGDPTPACRAQCSESRYICGTDDGCDARWATCVEACSAPTTTP